MIELILVMMVFGGLSAMFMYPIKPEPMRPDDFESLVIHTQFNALFHHTSMTVKSPLSTEYPIRFNANGNVNMGQTIRIGNLDVVIGIASGRIHEKSVYDD